MKNSWVMENMENIMLGVGIMSVSGVAAVFIIYFYVKRKVKNKNKSS